MSAARRGKTDVIPVQTPGERRVPTHAPSPRTGVAAPPPRRRKVRRILDRLSEAIPVPHVELAHHNPFELLVATILSAQCTDERVNRVTPALFRRFPTPATLAQANLGELEDLIRSTGFFKSKARSLIGCAKALTERFDGRVPRTMDELTSLPGVGRKTANVTLGTCLGEPAIVVDTHVQRVAQRLGLTAADDPERIETDLQRLFPREDWTSGSQRLLLHGRYVCVARRPRCGECRLSTECPWPGQRRE